MADDRDDSQRTEEPTQRRLEEAQKHGDIVKSQEVQTFVLLAGAALTITALGHTAAESFAGFFRMFLEQPDRIAMDGDSAMTLARAVLWRAAIVVAPALGLLMLCGLAGNLVQNRPSFTTEKIKPDFSKLSLVKGFQRMFGIEGLSNLVKGLLKISIVGAAVWTTLWPERGRLESVLTQSPADVAGDMIVLLLRVMLAALSVLAAMAALDYFLQRYQFLKRNRMSRQEIKDEFRQSEGDPAVKAKIRQIRIERAKRRMMANVPGATVVIANPTHYAVALKYEQGKTPAPICVAKGIDALALKIREVAEEHEIPIVENPPLARALYATVDLDESVPPEHYKAVAQVIGYVLKLTGKARH